ncbi:glucosyltransferase domain-containing protein [Pseudomonas fakonensis]|uniref:Glucosyltransferase domain-containing protein n=1 Tax=Pseudomonas fakonensis TaxID=2842355 RepID=A0ABX8N7R9_9PSED|nr:glucosyltransferase domain-containing protein [Pseudomonas fakonensis]QXH52388.1 glucosyltransferase domain-containing protein [Pseudomonas fakonensis]
MSAVSQPGSLSRNGEVPSPPVLYLICLLAIGVHVLPLVLADMPYIDDYWRAQAAGTGWLGEGRALTQWFYELLTFSGAGPNIFPLPLLIAVAVTAHALVRLIQRFFTVPRAVDALVVLPLWYNPFFLQNLTFQYDGPTMALGMAAMIYAVTLEPRRMGAWLGGAVLVGVGLGFYQVTLNLFVGLCCLDVLRALRLGEAAWPLLARRVCQLLIGCAVYALLALPFMTDPRQALLPLDGNLLLVVVQRLHVLGAKVALLLATPANQLVALALAGLALLGAGADLLRILRGQHAWVKTLAGACCYLLAIVGVPAAVSGFMLMFAGEMYQGFRTLMGFGCVLMLLFYLAQRPLAAWHRHAPWLLVIPLLSMLALAYAHGRNLQAQGELGKALSYYLGQDILSHREFEHVQVFYLIDPDDSDGWLPAAVGADARLPVLKYIRQSNYMLFPQMMNRAGIERFYTPAHFKSAPPNGWGRDDVVAHAGAAVLRRPFYDIYLVGDDAYVLLNSRRKEPAAP